MGCLNVAVDKGGCLNTGAGKAGVEFWCARLKCQWVLGEKRK